MERFIVFRLSGLRMALAMAAVERVVQAVYITLLPNAPDIILGVINVKGQIIPVVDMHWRLGMPKREITLTDRLIIARTARRPVALVANEVTGVIEYPESKLIDAAGILPDLEQVAGVVKLDDGLVFIHDLDRFLSLDEEENLDLALAATGDQ